MRVALRPACLTGCAELGVGGVPKIYLLAALADNGQAHASVGAKAGYGEADVGVRAVVVFTALAGYGDGGVHAALRHGELEVLGREFLSAYRVGVGKDFAFQFVHHKPYHAEVGSYVAPRIYEGGLGRVERDEGFEHRVVLGKLLGGVEGGLALVAHRADDDVARAGERFKHLVGNRRAVVRPVVYAHAHVDDAGLAHGFGIVHDVAHAIGHVGGGAGIRYEHDVAARRNAVVHRTVVAAGCNACHVHAMVGRGHVVACAQDFLLRHELRAVAEGGGTAPGVERLVPNALHAVGRASDAVESGVAVLKAVVHDAHHHIFAKILLRQHGVGGLVDLRNARLAARLVHERAHVVALFYACDFTDFCHLAHHAEGNGGGEHVVGEAHGANAQCFEAADGLIA